MDLRHKNDLKIGVRVAVMMGAPISEIYGTPPIVTTAVVGSEPMDDDTVWLLMDIAHNETLPQRYRIEEIIGFMLPMAIVTDDGNGTITAQI